MVVAFVWLSLNAVQQMLTWCYSVPVCSAFVRCDQCKTGWAVITEAARMQYVILANYYMLSCALWLLVA